MKKGKSFFKVGSKIEIHYSQNFEGEAELLKGGLIYRGIDGNNPSSGDIYFEINEHKYPQLKKEGYELEVTSEEIQIKAAHRKGAIHGLFTLMQLQQIQKDQQYIPAIKIVDTPRFAYRGMHLDVSRHFFPVSFVKKYLDMMALYKFNNFHWHLTDSEGWRLEIKKYPNLTEKTAYRSNGHRLAWNMWEEKFLTEGDPDAYGGYYTQEQAKEIVKYADRRGINVIPEIEMPGHSGSVTTAYPIFACSGKPYSETDLCICKDTTIAFLKDVLKEVMAIFPSKYIHMGGDEASKTSWKDCQACIDLMKENGYTDLSQLQSHAMKEIETFLNKHGRILVGWDEILEGGLAPNAIVMSWRGKAGGIAAARQNHDVIMTPNTYCYFDYYQTDPETQPKAIGGYVPITKVYSLDPALTDSLTREQQKHILGVQANMWTEYKPFAKDVEYMVFPRLLALSEVAWTEKRDKDFHDFHRRLQDQYRLLQRHHINYYRPSYRVMIINNGKVEGRGYKISFQSEQYQPVIRFTLDETEPTKESEKYEKPFYIARSTVIKAAIFKKGKKIGNIKTFSIGDEK